MIRLRRALALAFVVTLAVVIPGAKARSQDDDDDKPDKKQVEEKAERRAIREARALKDKGSRDEAYKAFIDAAELASSREHWKNAITAYEEAQPLAPDTTAEARILLQLSYCEIVIANTTGALTHLRRACEIDPKDATIRNNLGYVLHLEGQEAEALREYRACLELRPEYHLARLTLGQVARLAGDAREALGAHEALLDKAKSGALAHEGAWAYNFESKESQALAASVTFPTEGSKLGLIEVQVALDHAFLDEVAKARELLDTARADHPAAELRPAIDKALDDLGRALELRPAHFQLRFVAALLRQARGDDQRAREDLRAFVAAEKRARDLARDAEAMLAK